ncbi:MAG TPA: helical backbone metal receptor [Burkholderiales bacterium]|nr:helical backbone metal receptor [Burkholderiales bacterium]
MRRSALLCAAVGIPLVSTAATLRDDRGDAFELRAPAKRIVALSPNLVELAFAAGAGGNLAAAVRYSDYPPEASKLPQVGDASRIDVERVLALQPDLVLAWRSGNPAGDVERLKSLGLPVFVTEARRLGDIARLLRTLGTLAGTARVAEAAASAFERDLADLRRRYGGRRTVAVFYEIWNRPLLTVNGDHVISDVIALCGGRNVFRDAPVLTPAVSLEAVIKARPQVVLGGSSAVRREEFAASWAALPVSGLRALPVRYVPPDLIQRQTPRIAQGARVVCEELDEVRKR